MFAQLGRLSLATKTTVITVFALLLLAVSTYVVGDRVLTADAERVAAERQETNMRIAWHVLGQYGSSFRAEGTNLYVGDRLLNGWTKPVDEVKALVGGTATVFGGDMRVTTNVTKPDGSRAVGTPLAAGPAYDAVLRQGRSYRGETEILGKAFFTAYDPIKDESGRVIGVLYVGIPKADVLASLATLRSSMAGASFVIALIVTAACFFVCRAMFRPLAAMNGAMQRLAAGETEVDIPAQGRQDEIGRMAAALETFREAAIARHAAEARNHRAEVEREKAMQALAASLERVAAGDLTADVGPDFPRDYSVLGGHFDKALASLRTLIGTVMESTAAIRTGSSEIADASEDLARRTESNAASLEQTSAAAAQMNQRITATAAAASSTVERADQAIGAVGSGRSTADEAVQAMGRVSESAKGIDSVIEGLDKIAFQTRVLAMNAAVEAGRAGEAGRGFAVVADLVSALAMRAEEEAGRARDQLTATQTDIVAAVHMVEKVDNALSQIVGAVGEVHSLLGGIAADNTAQAGAIKEISVAIGSMDHATQQNAAMVEQTSAAARALMQQVASLDTQAATFRIGETAPVVARRPAPAPAPRPTPRKSTAEAAWTSF
ncbi:cache domain-containing protein [Sphingomonas sp. dw_22]|uniref:methyl-accepting chemotaxis protein n=1 Tax=Sphingomonas sp. dw_22 TaxID=2721175 RepID=UPI001BD536ED|nr:cache domain-containing protein [Sphingomonas sp. dw_22]